MQLPIVNDAATSRSSKPRPDDQEAASRGRYAVISLGCPKNLVDTEQMLGRLDEDGYQLVDSVDSADFVVVTSAPLRDLPRSRACIQTLEKTL